MVWVILQQVNKLQQIGESSEPPQNNFAMYFNVNDTLEISSVDNHFKDEIVMHNLKLWKVSYMQLIEYFKFDNAGSGKYDKHQKSEMFYIAQLDAETNRAVMNNVGMNFKSVFEGHSSSVRSVAYNHDSTKVISGSSDKSIKEWKKMQYSLENIHEFSMNDTDKSYARVKRKGKIVSSTPTTNEGIAFLLVPNIESVSTLKLTNRCNKTVAFKIKTNNTDRYLVQPNQGVIVHHGEEAKIQLFCLSKNVNDILEQAIKEPITINNIQGSDKFLCQVRTLTSDMMQKLTASFETEVEDGSKELALLFAKTPENKTKIQNFKYAVKFKSNHWIQPLSSSIV